jgi:hypothetical protein
VGSTGGSDGIVGTGPEGGVGVVGGGGGLLEVVDGVGKTIPAAPDVDGASDRIVLAPVCLRCSACAECKGRPVSVAKWTRGPGERPASKPRKRGREVKRVKSAARASRRGRLMTVNPVRHAVRRLRSSMPASAALLRAPFFSGGCERARAGFREWWGDGGGETEVDGRGDMCGG